MLDPTQNDEANKIDVFVSGDGSHRMVYNEYLGRRVTCLGGYQNHSISVSGDYRLIDCLTQTLLKHDLVDAYWIMIYPETLGGGKRLFADGTMSAAFKVMENEVTPKGVIIANYERTGSIWTWT